MPAGEKFCPQCKTSKPYGEFRHHKGRTDGLDSWCKLCRREGAPGRTYRPRSGGLISSPEGEFSKKCPVCEKVKPVSEFNRNKAKPDGIESWCRNCNRKTSDPEILAKLDQRQTRRHLDFENRLRYRPRILIEDELPAVDDSVILVKKCSKCEEVKPLASFYKNRIRKDGHEGYCKICSKARRADPSYWGKRQPDKLQASQRDSQLRRHYGINLADYQEMLIAQGNTCAICPSTEPGGNGTWHVDHDHTCCPGNISCGKCVRGLLCANHNTGLGMFDDNPEILRAAADYIERFRVD